MINIKSNEESAILKYRCVEYKYVYIELGYVLSSLLSISNNKIQSAVVVAVHPDPLSNIRRSSSIFVAFSSSNVSLSWLVRSESQDQASGRENI